MKIRQLEYFMHVANTLNITRAAERASISQPALSRQIQLLEEELGNRLLERKARGVILTPAGMKLAEHIRLLMLSVEHIKSDIVSAASEPVGSVRLAAAYSVSALLTADVVAQFHALYPRVEVQVIEGTSINIRDALITNKADVALYSDHGSFTGLNRHPLCSEDLVLIAPPEEKLSIDRPVDSSMLSSLEIILTPFPNGLRRVIDDAMIRHGELAQPALTIDTNSLILSLVRAGAGYSILPYSATHEAYQLGAVSIAPITDMNWQWVIATSRERPLTAAGRVLMRLLAKRTRELVNGGVWLTGRVTAADDEDGGEENGHARG